MTAARIRQNIDPKITVGNILTIIGILVGGVWYMAQNDARIEKLDGRLVAVERSILEAAVASNLKDDRASQKVEGIAREVGDVKVTVRGIETSVQFLVQQVQQQQRLDRRGPQ